MDSKDQKLISHFLIISLLILPMTLTANERRGADLVINKTDGNQVKGELIAVKRNSLLLKEAESGADWAVGVAEIKTITIVKKSKFLLGAGLGLLIGGGGGAIIGSVTEPEETDSPGAYKYYYGVFFGGLGLLLGAIWGLSAGKDKLIQIDGMPPETIDFYLEDLRKKARVPDFQ